MIRFAFDSGWSDGDPGDGRLRFNTPKIACARFAYVNAKAADEARLDELVPTFGVGDVLVMERADMPGNRAVAWILGPIYHGGSYYKIPIAVRSVAGSFAAHDDLIVSHYANVADDDPASGIGSLPSVRSRPSVMAQKKQDVPTSGHVVDDRSASLQPGSVVPTVEPINGAAPASVQAIDEGAARIAELTDEAEQLRRVIAHLVSDPTELLIEDKNG